MSTATGSGDDYRQVVLSARELARDLPGKGVTWVNRRLQYTHGYGLVMAPAADKTPGRTTRAVLIDDIPPVAPPALAVAQPAIYYGEEDIGLPDRQHAECPSSTTRSGDENVYTRYDGRGGVPLGSRLKRLVFALHELDMNILISDYVTAG